MLKNGSSLIVGFFALVFKTSRVLVFVLFLGFIVASHTITALAALTSTAISAVAGTASTVMGRSKANVNDLTAQNKRLRTDLDVEQRRASGLLSENAKLKKGDAIRFQGKSTTLKKASQEVIERTMARTSRATVVNVSSIPGESIPFYGIAIVLAATAYELKSACDNMTDLYDLQVAIDPDTARPEDRNAVCALQVPTKQEVWKGIKNAPKASWDASIEILGNVTDAVRTIEAPKFGAIWQRSMDVIATRF